MRLVWGMLGGLAISGIACGLAPFCDRAGCVATESAATPAIEQGVAGAVSSSSDVCENGCCECPLTSARLVVFATATLATTAAEVDEAVLGTPSATLDVDGRYEQTLDAGAYVLCQVIGEEAPGPCVPFDVAAGGVTTVNLELVFGPPSFRVFEADGSEVTSETFRCDLC